MMRVIGILLIGLAAAGCPDAGPAPRGDGGRRVTMNQLRELASATELFYLEYDRWPADLEELTHPGPDGRDPCLEEVPTDLWGHDFVYALPAHPAGRYRLFSRGPDGIAGTADDVTLRTR